MTSLTARFGRPPDVALEACLRAALETARAWGVVAPEQHVEVWRVAFEGDVADVRWAELLLVAAVIAGDEAGLARFDGEFLTPAAQHVGRRYPQLEVAELAQSMRERLLVGEGIERLRVWRGHGALSAWLRAVATRLALDLLPHERQQSLEAEAWERAVEQLTVTATPEAALLQQSHRAELKAALSEALRRLPRREKVVLRLHVFQALSSEQLGRVFHVAPSTVRRWIHGARATVVESVRAVLAERTQWSSSQIDSALGRLSNLDLSLTGLTERA